MSLLTAKGIRKSFNAGAGEKMVLNNAGLNIDSGELVTILGPSGSGKSTLLNICGLIDSADRGEILWQDQDLLKLSVRSRTEFRRANIGFVFQSFNLIPVMTAFDNVAFPLMLLNWPSKKIHKRVNTLLEQVGLADHARYKPGQLSGGQCQRIAIARALVKQPALIIADEPTASLDADTAIQVMALMKQLMVAQQTACLVATHDSRLMPFSDRVLHVDHGHVVEEHDMTVKGVVA
ncbi:MAG: ABC transporter ATP-binding protein [Reinekea sp.]|jgi:putative ABC transport system ATP-binding protein